MLARFRVPICVRVPSCHSISTGADAAVVRKRGRPRKHPIEEKPKEPKRTRIAKPNVPASSRAQVDETSRRQATQVLESLPYASSVQDDSTTASLEDNSHYPSELDVPLKHPAALDGPVKPLAKSTHSSDNEPVLPPPSMWKTVFSVQRWNHMNLRDRVSIKNAESARWVAESFVPSGLRDQVVIEAFPGPGALTRALLALPKERIRKLIVLEDWPQFVDYLRPLEQMDPRLHLVPLRGFHWDTYDVIEQQGLLDDVSRVPWDDVHPQLRFISHLEQSVSGEQLICQLFRSIPEKAWLFKYGRVPLKFLLAEKVLQRILAGPFDAARCKLSVIAEGTASVRRTLLPSSLQPYKDHYFPETYRDAKGDHLSSMAAISIIPHKEQIISVDMLDKWDYCLRRLFTLKSTALKQSIYLLGAGAQSLLKPLTDPSRPAAERVDANLSIRRLTVQDWAKIIRAFDEWPFAPESLSVAACLVEDRRW